MLPNPKPSVSATTFNFMYALNIAMIRDSGQPSVLALALLLPALYLCGCSCVAASTKLPWAPLGCLLLYRRLWLTRCRWHAPRNHIHTAAA